MTLPHYRPLAGRADMARPEQVIEHLGLLLDRFAPYSVQNFSKFDMANDQKPHILRVIEINNKMKRMPEAADILSQWDTMIATLPFSPVRWTQTTVWRLASHLSRASPLENGSVCLHPIYGFAYLPGSGLKGMAAAYAYLSIKDRNGDPATDSDFLRIFGNNEKRRLKPDGTEDETDAIHGRAGSVDFMEAWPTVWPVLEVDIVNNHHREYYQNAGQGGHAPGDWESPVPTYFLAVQAGTRYRFGIAKRDIGTADSDLVTARMWLQGALENLGAGAKTAAAYGYFDNAGA